MIFLRKLFLASIFLLALLPATVTIDSDFYFDGYLYSLTDPDPRGFIINDTPLISVSVNGSAIDFDKFSLLIDGVQVLQTSPYNYSYNITDGLFTYQVDQALSVGAHTFVFSAEDTDNRATRNFTATVKANEVSLMDPPIPFPSPATSSVNITYRLQKIGDLELFIYDIKGRLIYNEEYISGAPGARPGYNEVPLDVSRWRNGVYIVLIAAEINNQQKIIGKTKFIVAK